MYISPVPCYDGTLDVHKRSDHRIRINIIHFTKALNNPYYWNRIGRVQIQPRFMFMS